MCIRDRYNTELHDWYAASGKYEILIAFEMFGFKGVPFYLIAVSISYAASGYYGCLLYTS